MERDTMCIQAGYEPKNGESRMIPIIQSTTFKYDTSEDMGKLFDLEAEGYFYTRLQNPTNDMVAAKIAALEGGTAAMLTSSGQAASFFSVFNLAGCGDHVVASSTHRALCQGGPCPWSSAHHRQYFRDAYQLPSLRVGRGYRCPLHHKVYGRP